MALVRLREHGYNNQCFILNYSEPNRFTETMNAAFTASTMKQALSKPLLQNDPWAFWQTSRACFHIL
jgi:hypothetical protein